MRSLDAALEGVSRASQMLRLPTSTTSPTSPTAPAVRPSPSAEAIRVRAYFLYVESGCLPGRDTKNWVRAEQELAQR